MFTGDSAQQSQLKPIKSYQTQTQWSLNPTAYQNLANDQVDWAALAQQWIQMKETYPPDIGSLAPPPPSFSNDVDEYEEKGEAPMEVEKEEEPQSNNLPVNGSSSNWDSLTSGTTPITPSPWDINSSSQSQWKVDWNSWNQNNTETESRKEITKNLSRTPLLPSPVNFPAAVTSSQSSSNNEYWSSSKSRFVSSSSDYHKKRERSSTSDSSRTNKNDEETLHSLDAAKRKTLPVWIREGLEKMEREKLRQEEKEREKREREILYQQRRLAEEQALKELEKESLIPRKSKFDSESDDEMENENNGIEERVPDVIVKQKLDENLRTSPTQKRDYRPRDEIIQDLMLSVRKNLTEILLEVTNEEIFSIATETMISAKKKAPTAQTLRKTALTTPIGGLGLGIYDDSSDDSDSDSYDGVAVDDSDVELKESIKTRKTLFEKTTREIESQIAEQEEREERRRKEKELEQVTSIAENQEEVVGSSDNIDGNNKRKNYLEKDGETHLHDKSYIRYGRSTREKKPSRFSDPRDIVKNVQTHVSIMSQLKPETIKEEIETIKSIDNEIKQRKSNDSHSSSSESHTSKHRKHRKSKKSSHHKRSSKYDESEGSDSSENDVDSHRSSTRRSRSRDYYRSDRSEESRSSHRRDRSRSRSRDHYGKSRDYYRKKRSSRDRDHKSEHSSHHKRHRSRSKSKSYEKSSRDHYSKSYSKHKSSRH